MQDTNRHHQRLIVFDSTIPQIRESVKGVKDSAEALSLYQDFVTQKARAVP